MRGFHLFSKEKKMTEDVKMETLEDAREFFGNDRFAKNAGMTIEEVGIRHSVIKLTLGDEHLNAVDALMGGVVCTMADFACAVASNFGTGTGQYVSSDAHVSFVNACRGKELTAEAVCIKSGRKLSYYEVAINDDTKTLIAKASVTMYRVG